MKNYLSEDLCLQIHLCYKQPFNVVYIPYLNFALWVVHNGTVYYCRLSQGKDSKITCPSSGISALYPGTGYIRRVGVVDMMYIFKTILRCHKLIFSFSVHFMHFFVSSMRSLAQLSVLLVGSWGVCLVLVTFQDVTKTMVLETVMDSYGWSFFWFFSRW